MIIDHIGYFLYPDILWLRMIWRLAFPLFFLLIGRNWSSKVWLSLIIGAAIVQWSLWWFAYFYSVDLRQLNILPAAIIVKLLLGVVWTRESKYKKFVSWIPSSFDWLYVYLSILGIIIACTLLAPNFKEYIEYGTMILGTALTGKVIKSYYQQPLLIIPAILICFWWRMQVNSAFPFNTSQRILVYLLRVFDLFVVRSLSYSNKTIHFNSHDNLILFISKQAIWIYVIHFILLLGIILTKKL